MEFKKHHRTLCAIKAQASKINITYINPNLKYWTAEAIEILKTKFPTHGRDIPELFALGYTKEDISAKGRVVCGKHNNQMLWNQWTDEEDLNLQKLFNDGFRGINLVNEYIKLYPTVLQVHTKAGIKARCKTLRLITGQAVRPFTDSENTFIINNAQKLGSAEVAKILDRKRHQIQKQMKILGINMVGPLNSKKILCIETGYIFSSGRLAACWATGRNVKDSGSIGQQLKKNKISFAYGYHWKYAEEE